MMRYQSLRHRPRHFQSFTGLRVEEFDRLVAIIRTDWVLERALRLTNPHRKRREGGGRKYALPELEDQLLLTLVWSRLYPVYLVLEYLFNIDESTVSRTLLRIQPLLKDRFTLPERLPKKKIKTIEELKEFLPPDIDFEGLLTDATEQKLPRPQDKRKRKKFHSGKKHSFTLKTQITTTRRGYITHVSDTIGGRRHDYHLFKKSRLPQSIPKDCPLYTDLAYEGAKKRVSGSRYPAAHQAPQRTAGTQPFTENPQQETTQSQNCG